MQRKKGNQNKETDGRWIKKILEWRPKVEKYRKRGRPPARWVTT